MDNSEIMAKLRKYGEPTMSHSDVDYYAGYNGDNCSYLVHGYSMIEAYAKLLTRIDRALWEEVSTM
jgi:hypothetical protein